MSEWLRRWTRNPLGSARKGSNPFGVVLKTQAYTPEIGSLEVIICAGQECIPTVCRACYGHAWHCKAWTFQWESNHDMCTCCPAVLVFVRCAMAVGTSLAARRRTYPRAPRCLVICGARTHAELPPVDLKSTPLSHSGKMTTGWPGAPNVLNHSNC